MVWNVSPGDMVGQVVPDSRGNGSLPIQGSSGPFCCHFLEKVAAPWLGAVDDLQPRLREHSLWGCSYPSYPRASVLCIWLRTSEEQRCWWTGGPQRVSIFFFLSLNMVPGCFFMSAVGVAHTSCVCGTGGLLPSLRGWVANLMLTEPGDVKGKFILTPTKTVMETSGKIPAGGFGDRKESRLSSPVA